MTKIAFIGAGSFGFTRNLVKDILTFPLLEGATLALMDVNPERLDYIQRAVNRIVTEGHYPARVEATTDRAEALKGADAVICTILAGGVDVWQHDILIPEKYGVDINVGDTRGPSGVFRALRTIPVMLDICHDMERYCPEAMLLNYTNPMAMLCRAMQRESDDPGDGPVPQRAGHRRDAGRLDRRADGGDHLRERGHQPPGVVYQRTSGTARTPTR